MIHRKREGMHCGENCAEMIPAVGDHGFVFASYHAWPHLITTKLVFSLLEDSLFLCEVFIKCFWHFGFSDTSLLI